MTKLVIKENKRMNTVECTMYAGEEKWFRCDEIQANDIIQKNKVKEFETFENANWYFEIYTF